MFFTSKISAWKPGRCLFEMPGAVCFDTYRRLWRSPAGGSGYVDTEKLSGWHTFSKMEGSFSSKSSSGSASVGRSNASKFLQKRPSRWTRMSLDNWVWELSAALLCTCILATIVGILFTYDNRRLPDLPDGLNVNLNHVYGATEPF